MRASAVQTSEARVASRPHRLINPVTGYGAAILGSVAFWALLLSAVF